MILLSFNISWGCSGGLEDRIREYSNYVGKAARLVIKT